MTPSYAVKKGVRYRYYISAPLIQGQPDKAAKLNRVPAIEIEKPIIGAVREHGQVGSLPPGGLAHGGLAEQDGTRLLETLPSSRVLGR